MAARLPEDERLCDLLTARATEGLAPAEQQELHELTTNHPEFDPDELDRVAASLALAGLRIDPLPAALRARIEADAQAWLERPREAPRAAVVTPLPARPRPTTAWGGWLAAAAALVLAITGWLQVEQQEASPAALLAELETRPGTRVIPWSATEDPAAGGAQGAVVWNGAAQAGVMRFRGLQPNDPATSQYQLWIFDARRDDRYPVDGGVFDVPPGAGETLVPIRARLPVGEAVLFAITVEAAGGVVVSTRERIALVAQPGA